ncbi:zinc-dependent alcohol dehydrogenase family protein [Marinobacterium rhizophilum]|uniref:Zinc-dependent alcohol dehydrogenase family protein n=1 Tax=Marinobacterium rhizophilum TaxID=420402 RepID=A0ABY5HMM5_9GAMM|nr:zinc-dependent alcohol dehydrogenase family protein [Marinobacterium rhizophilum]UTW13359.1 zinc-dependent alcohol dehydrogenase family protein [Marinobacterium rhizophilum]
MKAMILNEYGDNAEFQLTELPTPSIKAGQVLVRVAATSVNTIDTMIRQLGQENLPLSPSLPAVLGMDFAGTVEMVGDGVTQFAPGDEVYGCAGGLADLQGALAEYMLADSRLVAHKPKSLTMREAAALPMVGITAYEGLQRVNVQANQAVLVHGGTGGVGHVAVQLARHFGADVYATGSGEKQMSIIEQYGATAIDYRTQTVADYVAGYTNGAGFEAIFDSVGGANLANSFEAAALNGQITTTLAMAELDLTPAHLKGLSLHIIFMLIPMLHDHKREDHGNILAKLSEIVDAGGLRPLLDDKHFGLADVGDAYARLASGQAIGKVVVEI